MKKKTAKKSIISLALCAFACCIAGGVSFLRGGDVKAAAATAPVYNTLEAFTIEEEGSIRTSDYNGIRFRTVLEKEELDAIEGLNLTSVQYGTLILPADYLGSQELTHATANVLDIQTKKWQQEGTEWTSVLAGAKDANGEYTSLPESYNNRPLAARSYVTGIKDGVTVYYYTENTVVRSIGYVAHMEEQTQVSVTDQVANISKNADIKVEFVNASQISANQSDPANGVVELISNKLPNSTDKLAVLTIGGVPHWDATVSYKLVTGDAVSVNGTTVTAKKVGTATVTASVTYDEVEYTATREINTDTFVGASEYKILISEEAKTASAITYANFANGGIATSAQYEKAAAELLQKIFAEATGVELPIVTSADDKFISIGATGKETGKAVSTTKDTSAQVFVDGYNVYILGKKAPEAVYYGTHQFLTDTVGYEFLMENTYSYDANTEVQAAATAYEPDIEYNVIQSDLRGDGVMDGYFMQDYTRDMIPLGINKTNQKSAFHQGVAHNSVLVLHQAALANNVASGLGTITHAGDADYKYYGSRYNYGSAIKNKNFTKWYATNTVKLSSAILNTKYERYCMIENPYYGDSYGNDPFALRSGDTITTQYEYIPAELCYTAHGDSTARTAMITYIGNDMLAELANYPTRTRLGFSHMDHRHWCTCTSCAKANPSDNLLTFLLDLAAYVKKGLTTAGDGRAETFKISSLFYHATNKAFQNTYSNDNLKHVEIWFAESAADYTIPLTKDSNWNTGVLNNFNSLTGLGDEVDVLWWGYYGMVTQFYVPFDSFDAIRANYALAAGAGVDYMFNQMMMSNQNFARLKEYLMSKLAWNADVKDDEWNGWIESYFKGAYGDGWEKMYKYFAKDSEDTTFTSWRDWTTSKDFTNTTTYNSTNAEDSDASIWHDDDLTSSGISKTVLQGWIDTIDQAINALDPNDPNYDTYYWNIKLEKATPLYLMLYIYGENQANSTHEATSSFSENGKTYVKQYGAEFLEIIAHWDLKYFGEGESRSIDNFKSGITTILNNATTTTVKDEQIVPAGSSFTLNHAAITAGDYTVRVISADGVTSPEDEVKASAGSITIPATITAGKTYIVELLSSAGNVIRFTNVHTRTESANHQVMAKTQYMFCDEQDLLLKDSAIKAGTTYTVKIDARQYTATSYVNGKLSVPIGQMAVNTNKKVLCDDGTTTYEFNVICANPIRTAEDLKALGMGNNNNTALKDITGYYVLANDITFVHQDDWSDLIAAGYDAASDGVKDDKGNYINKYHFKGVFDGNGYTIDNMRVSDGGIFGTATEATIKNVNLTNVHLIEDIPTGLSEQNGGYIAIFAYTAPKSTFENINITMATSPNNKWTWKRDGLFVCSGSSGAATFRNITVDASGLMLKTLLGISHNEANVYENVVIKAADYVAVGYTGDSYKDGEQNTDTLITKETYPDGVTFEEVGLCITTEETEVRANGSLTVKTNQEGVTYDLETKITGVSIGETTGELTVSNRVEIGTKITVIATSADGSAKKTFTVIRALETYTAATQNVEMGHYLDGTTVVMPTSATIDLSEIYDTYLAGSNVTVTCGDTTWYQGVFGSNSWTITLDESMKSWSGIKNFVFTSETNTCEYVITLPVNFVQGVIELDKDNVGSPTDLQAIMKSNMGGHYVLTSDLDMGGEQLKGWGVTPFTGVLDGNGYGIVNTQLNYGGTDGETNGYRPVLIVRNEGTVKNIRFEINGYNYTAGNTGRGIIVTNVGTVSNVYMTLNLNYNAGLNLSGWGHGWDPSHGNEDTWTGGLVEKNYGAIENAIVKVTKNDGITIKSEFIGALAYKNYASGTVTGYMISDIDTIEAVQINEGTATVNRYSAWNSELISNISSWTAPWDNLAYGVCFGNSIIYEDPNASATEINKTVTMSIKDGVVTLPDGIGGTIKSVTFNGVEIFVSVNDDNEMTFDGADIPTADLGANKTLIVKTSENKYQLQAIAVTDIITTADELRALGIGGNRGSTANIDGYYVLGNDISFEHADNYSDLVAAGYPSGSTISYSFLGTFDGCGHTLYNMRVSDGGIFGIMCGTVRNLNMVNVHMVDSPAAGVSNQNGGYISILAHKAPGGKMENINISIASSPTGWSWKRDGLLVNTSSSGAATFRNITIDASGIALKTLLGTHHSDSNVYENVVIKAASYTAIGYTGDSYLDGVQNTAALMTAFPTGVTFTKTNSMVAQNSDYASAYEVYQGDVEELGFEKGARVVKSGIDVSSWNTAYPSRAKLGYIDTDYDYVDIPFLTTNAFTWLHVWTPGQHFTISSSGVVTHDGDDPGRIVSILNASGNKVSSFAANTVYTLRVYIDDANGTAATELSLTMTLAGNTGTIYFGDVSFANEVEISVEELDATVTIETYNNTTVTLPETISGNVVAVTVGGVEIFNSATGYGSVSGNVITMGDDLSKSQSNLGEDKEMLVTMEDGTIYKLTANVYTMIINNAAELDQWQAVAADVAYMQGLVIEAQKKAVLSGYFALGNDILYNKVWSPILTFGNIWHTLDKTGSVGSTVVNDEKAIFEGWTEGNKAGFKGVFDGNGYKIDGMATSGQYSAFVVVMGGGTIKDVAFTNATIGATSSFVTDRGNGTIENVYVQVVSMASGNTGAGDNFTTVIKRGYSNYTTSLVDNVIVDFSASGFAGLQYAYVADTGRYANNIYVIGVPETVTLNVNYKAEGDVAVITSNYKDPFLFKELDLNANSGDGDDVKAFANAYALVADETYKANVTSWGDLWKIDENNALYFGSHMIHDGTPIIDLDETVTVSIKDGTFVLPTGVKGTVSSITLNGTEILTSISDGVVTFNKEVMPTDATMLGAGKTLIIITDKANYSVNADIYTDVITTLDELKALGVGGMRDVTADVTGYYVLGNDITVAHQDDYSDVAAAGYPKNDNYYYKATFDGLGHTIDGIRVADGGIFGLMRNGVVKNVNFKNVYYQDDAPASVTNQSGGYMALLAFSAPSSTFENINVHVAYTADTWSYKRSGVLVCSSSWGAATYRNITVDASGIKLRMLLGISHSENNVYENVVFKAVDYVAIGYTGDSYNGGVENTAAKMNAFPAGVSFETAYAAVAMDKAYASVYSYYDGNVTDLGFAAGTNVVEANITDAWNHRSHIYVLPDYDYVDIQFALSQSMVLCMWDGNAGNYDITASGGVVSGTSGAAERLIQVFDANGEEIATFEANTMYVLRVYLDDVNGGNRVKKLQLSTFAGERTIYYGNITFGNNA